MCRAMLDLLAPLPVSLHIVYISPLAWQNKNKLTSIDADNNQIAITTKQNK